MIKVLSLRISTQFILAEVLYQSRLELGIPPAAVADLVGHSMKTMEKFYKNVKLKNMESELVVMRKKKLEDGDFQTFDLEQMPLPQDNNRCCQGNK